MKRKHLTIPILGLVLTLLGVMADWGSLILQAQNCSLRLPIISKLIPPRKPPAKLKISGMNASVNINRGRSPYKGGDISAMNTSSSIYISENQLLEVDISGLNVTLNIEASIADHVTVNSSGLGTRVNEI